MRRTGYRKSDALQPGRKEACSEPLHPTGWNGVNALHQNDCHGVYNYCLTARGSFFRRRTDRHAERRLSAPALLRCHCGDSDVKRYRFTLPSPISVLLRDCFSQSDRHIAPITMPTESDAQAIRTVMLCLLFSISLPSFERCTCNCCTSNLMR